MIVHISIAPIASDINDFQKRLHATIQRKSTEFNPISIGLLLTYVLTHCVCMCVCVCVCVCVFNITMK